MLNYKGKFAVIGATGVVGRELLAILSGMDVDVENVFAVASEDSLGKELEYGEETICVDSLKDFDFSKVSIAFFVAGSDVSKEYIPKCTQKGVIVIDNSSYYRSHSKVPLVIPEINPDAIADYKNMNIIANPNCSTIQMLVALHKLHSEYKIKRIVASTYQSVSGAGTKAMQELFNQTQAIFQNEDPKALRKHFTKQMAFNVIPHIGDFREDDSTQEEWKMNYETKKILDPNIEVSVTCVRVPVFFSHSEALNVEFEKDIDYKNILELIKASEGVEIFSHSRDEGYITPIEAEGENTVLVSRVRLDETKKNTISMWVVSDNIRKGAALNAVQIANKLIQNFLSAN